MAEAHFMGFRRRNVAAMTSPYALRSLRTSVLYRVEDARAMGWAELEHSWMRDLVVIDARMAELGIAVEGPWRQRGA